MVTRPKGRPAAPHWTDREVRLMMELADSGVTYVDIGRRLGRSALAVQERANKARRDGYAAAPRDCQRCGKRLARLNLSAESLCYACGGPVIT